jgi:hypothetical protein
MLARPVPTSNPTINQQHVLTIFGLKCKTMLWLLAQFQRPFIKSVTRYILKKAGRYQHAMADSE